MIHYSKNSGGNFQCLAQHVKNLNGIAHINKEKKKNKVEISIF